MMGTLPRPEVTLRPLHFRATPTLAHRTVTDGTNYSRVQLRVPELHPHGLDRDDVTHKRKDGTK